MCSKTQKNQKYITGCDAKDKVIHLKHHRLRKTTARFNLKKPNYKLEEKKKSVKQPLQEFINVGKISISLFFLKFAFVVLFRKL